MRWELQSTGAFDIDRRTVTCNDFRRCISAGACSEPGREGSGDHCDHDVAVVTYSSAERYCQWRHARLPRVVEWERAARDIFGDASRGDLTWTLATFEEWVGDPMKVIVLDAPGLDVLEPIDAVYPQQFRCVVDTQPVERGLEGRGAER
jgi:formylglycine-generating enzyme required for sulfatase activity